MAIQITREEYEKKFGKPPVVNKPAPTKITRAEYEARFGKKPEEKKPLIPTLKAVPNQPVRNTLRTFANIPSSALKLGKEVIAPVNPFNIDSPLNIGSNIVKGVGAIKDIASTAKYTNVGKDLVTAPVDVVKKGAGIVSDITKAGVKQVKQRGLGGALAEGVSQVAEVGIEDPLLIPSLIYTPSKIRGTGVVDDTITKIAGPVTKRLEAPITKTKEAVMNKLRANESTLENKIVQKFEKGIKPSVAGKKTEADVKRYETNIVDAVDTISKNKDNLRYVDELGEEVVGQTPKSIKQLSDAVEQTKKTIFNEYDALAKQAGDAGVTVNVSSIAGELDAVINNKALAITNPKAITYAQQLKERLIATGDLDTITAQDVIQNYNKSLEAFYRNPSYDTASQAAIDAMIANRMRVSLDEGISNLTGANYQALKQKYGSLKAIEKDVVKAALRDARKNNVGLIDYTDIFTGGDLITGLVTMNPAQLARGATARGIKEVFKYLNDPNRAVEGMFKSSNKLDQLRRPKIKSNIPMKNNPTSSGKNLLQSQPVNNNPATPMINANIPKNIPQTAKNVQIKDRLLKGIDTKGIELDVRPLSESVLELSWINAPKQGDAIISQIEKNAKAQGFKTIQGSIKRDASATKLKEIWSKKGYQIFDDKNMNTIIIMKNLK